MKSKKAKMVRKKAVKRAKAPKAAKARKVKKALIKKVIKKEEKKKEAELPKAPPKPPQMDPKDLEKIGTILASSHVRQILIEVGGENALALIRNFYGNHSDDELAKKLKLKISDVRATLNKLHNEGLVNYMREKDNETGWYSYSWSLNLPRIERWASSQSVRLGEMSNDGGEYYFCGPCGASSIVDFESAANGDFRCERCNKMLEFIDDKKMLELYEKKKV